ncbi:MAG: AMP-binding protein [Actinophytocola sp.]|uniref:AMP-binding protein n=1 Tax=Actinophytocola sp. TaxID=1872138 RepID=UPI0013230F42|nr:AMP-binding protein [Actinophytocola sp.]MPZ83631.1 AMP-binding protein [Actinophytocola sp.]
MWGTLPRVFDRACTYHADRTAVVDGDRRISYREMGAWANRVANGLVSLGVEQGDRVGLLMPNSLEFIPTQYGIWKTGAALVQMPTRAGAEDLRFFLAESGASTVVYHARFDEAVAKIRGELPALRRLIRLGGGPAADVVDYDDAFGGRPATAPAVDIDEDGIAYVAFTSGTTGVPKGLLQSHRSWSHYAVTAGLEIGDTRAGEVFAHVAPLTHFTQTFVLPTFVRGGTNVMMPGLDIEALLEVVGREKVTATAIVPTILYLLLDHPRRTEFDLSSLRTMIYAGSPMAPERLRQGLEVFGQIFVQSYAGSEPGYTTCLRKEEHRVDTDEWVDRLASAGRPMLHVDVSIQDDEDNVLPTGEIGEICARQEGQMISYVDESRNAEAMRDGWVHSGDIGYFDDAGYVYIVDRKKDMIVTGGFNVFPRQVEDVLLEHPAVAQCAVIGVPHEKWGEAVTAFVVTKADMTATPDELVALVKERKGSVWAPKTVELVTGLPVNAAGKVDKKTLRAPYWAGRKRQVG